MNGQEFATSNRSCESNHVEFFSGTGLVRLEGVGDPTGRNKGISYLRVAAKNFNPEAPTKANKARSGDSAPAPPAPIPTMYSKSGDGDAAPAVGPKSGQVWRARH